VTVYKQTNKHINTHTNTHTTQHTHTQTHKDTHKDTHHTTHTQTHTHTTHHTTHTHTKGTLFIKIKDVVTRTRQSVVFCIINLLRTKLYLFDLKTESVPRCKHSLPRL